MQDEQVVSALLSLQSVNYQKVTYIDDTRLLTGSEALAEAIFYYGSSREAANRGVVQAKPIYDDLKARFMFRKGVSTTSKPSGE